VGCDHGILRALRRGRHSGEPGRPTDRLGCGDLHSMRPPTHGTGLRDLPEAEGGAGQGWVVREDRFGREDMLLCPSCARVQR
jgi:hypothetical protein